ncbi:MAG: DUF5107 domain-containing protein [Paludibacteraceae bacterium]|nr:DUF5107 domain-containing protein [Paludibacteraceae bacterium]
MKTIKDITETTVFKRGEVRAWHEQVLIPTYGIGKEEKNPIFLEKRVYQGSSGSVYPYAVVEKIEDEKHDVPYDAYFIENYYVKIMILPALGGRVQMAWDKIKKRHFVYFNEVIKPALVGLTGPWISGGIEFNWPQHHRPSTFLPTDVNIEENSDGSKTVWCGELERMARTQGAQGFTLYPDKAYLAIRVRLFNRTPYPQTFLWWANPAVVVHEHYYSVFPPDVNAVYDHGKRDVTEFPISHGVYYKHNYAPGTDISRYINIPVPTSYMAVKSKYDFVGGYEDDVRGGLLHVADHNVSTGKKQWTWGNGDFGRAWDRNLTDNNGPYIELMTGMYCDNQPDFSWLQPFEERTWTQYFMPYAEVGMVKNASKDVLLHFSVSAGKGRMVVYTTGVKQGLKIVLTNTQNNEIVGTWQQDVAPENVFENTISLADSVEEHYKVQIYDCNGRLLLTYSPEPKSNVRPVPEPAKPQKLPQEIELQEQLYLTGLHLEQYRHATYRPEDYYEEALRRDSGDIRCNNAMGLLFLRKGKPEEAEKYLRRAVATMTERNPNPYDGEPYYNLGIALMQQDKLDDSLECFWKATWNAAWQDSAFFMVAQIESRKGNFCRALEVIERSLIRNAHNTRALVLKAALLHILGNESSAKEVVMNVLVIDSMNLAARYLLYLMNEENMSAAKVTEGMRATPHDFIEYALDFAAAGMYETAISLLKFYIKNTEGDIYPVVYYAVSDFLAASGNRQEAEQILKKAESACPDGCFPNREEEVRLLKHAIVRQPDSPKAYYYLGNFFYSKRLYEDAQHCWLTSIGLDDSFPTVWRNMALVYYNKLHDKQKALDAIERAFSLDETDSRVFMELYQLYKKLGRGYNERKVLLEKHMNLVEERDDMMVEYVQLLNQQQNYTEALRLTLARHFHPWEGGEGKITGQYKLSLREMAKQKLAAGMYQEALLLLQRTDVFPENLGEGKLETMPENDIDFYKALALQGMGRNEEAKAYFKKATAGQSVPQQAFYYNDSQPDMIYYQALAWHALGDDEHAKMLFDRLLEHGRQHLNDTGCRIDYFAVSLPELAIWEDDLDIRNRIHCLFVMGLGYLGNGEKENAAKCLAEVLQLDPNHQSAQVLLDETLNTNTL